MYPKEFKVVQEVFIAFILNWILTWHYALFVNLKDSFGLRCIGGIFSQAGIGEIMRSSSFILTLSILTWSPKSILPFPHTWIFKDLNKLMQEPICFEIFSKYIEEKEPSLSRDLEDFMKAYMSYFQCPLEERDDLVTHSSSTGSYLLPLDKSTINPNQIQDVCNDSLRRLKIGYDRFKQTVAYEKLLMKIQEFEEISELIHIH